MVPEAERIELSRVLSLCCPQGCWRCGGGRGLSGAWGSDLRRRRYWTAEQNRSGPPEANIPPGEQMFQISAYAQTVLLSHVIVGRVWDAELAENAPGLRKEGLCYGLNIV